MKEEKVCKHCKEFFIPGRSNQEFCSDEHKKKYNNHLGKELRDATKNVDYKLHQNFKILRDFYENEITQISEEELEKRGFQFEYFTGIAPGNDEHWIMVIVQILQIASKLIR